MSEFTKAVESFVKARGNKSALTVLQMLEFDIEQILEDKICELIDEGTTGEVVKMSERLANPRTEVAQLKARIRELLAHPDGLEEFEVIEEISNIIEK